MSSADKDQRLAVTGAGGCLAAPIWRQAAAAWPVVGIGRRHAVAVTGIDVSQGDLTDHAFDPIQTTLEQMAATCRRNRS